MKSSLQATIFVLAATLLGVLFMAGPSEAITCNDVTQNMKPCISYLQSGSGLPPPACCAGAKGLAASATTTADKQVACGCIESASKNLKLNAQLSQSLPKNCGISLPYPISPTFDCKSIH